MRLSKPSRRLRTLEKLESRQLMAADISLNNGVLEIEGTPYSDDVEIRFYNDRVRVRTEQGNSDRTRRYDIEDVSQILIHGYAGNDQVHIYAEDLDSGVTLHQIQLEFYGGNNNDTLLNETDIPTYAEGGNHDDTLIGGSGNDVLIGGTGDDTLEGAAGNDILEGGLDDDVLVGGVGDDTYRFANYDLGLDQIVEYAGQGLRDEIDLSGMQTPETNELIMLDLQTTNEQYLDWNNS
ncbi:MAG: hypothetical protein NXI32_31405, partial [bacterium]|nr:hypothetical protein [bacterium]